MSKTLTVFVADLHVGDYAGMMPPSGVLGQWGSTQLPSVYQEWMEDEWRKLWNRIFARARKAKARVKIVFVGDLIDWNKFTARMITRNRATLVDAAFEVIRSVVRRADESVFLRGTSAHDGPEGELTELLAQRASEKYPGKVYKFKHGNHSAYKWTEVVNGVRLHARHKPLSNSNIPSTRGMGALRTAHRLAGKLLRAEKLIPDVAVFGHVHHVEESGRENAPMLALYLPAWKGEGSYEKANNYDQVDPPGVWWVMTERGEYDYRLESAGRYEEDE